MTFIPYKSRYVYLDNNYLNLLLDTYKLCNRGRRLTCVIVNYLGIEKIAILNHYFTPRFILELYINIYLNIMHAENMHYKSSEENGGINIIMKLSVKYSLKNNPEYFLKAYERAFSFSDSPFYEGDILLDKNIILDEDPELIHSLFPDKIYNFLYEHVFEDTDPEFSHIHGYLDLLILFSSIKLPYVESLKEVGKDDGTEIIIDEYLLAHLGP
jgi:hypothetical protein